MRGDGWAQPLDYEGGRLTARMDSVRYLASSQLPACEREREDVASQIELLPHQSLGGKPSVGALRGGDVVISSEGATNGEIGERDALVVFGEHKVGRLEVAVEDRPWRESMEVMHCARQLP